MSDPLPPPSVEDRWLDSALARYRDSAGSAVRLGPGHDTAAVAVDGGIAVVTTDVLVEGVHFRRSEATPALIARKALAVNLSDLAAAAAVPVGFVVGGVFPKPADQALFDALADGFASAASEFGCPCVGGDTNVADGPLVLAVTALGQAGPMGVLSRSGAIPGMEISVTGALGGSRGGRHLTFTPRLAEAHALAVAGVPAAMMDLSDGLGVDLARLCRASAVGAIVHAGAIPVHPDADVAAADSGKSALEHALSDGEDFELLVAHTPLTSDLRAALLAQGVSLTTIGSIHPLDAGLQLEQGGTLGPWPGRGYDHLA